MNRNSISPECETLEAGNRRGQMPHLLLVSFQKAPGNRIDACLLLACSSQAEISLFYMFWVETLVAKLYSLIRFQIFI